ncbi:MAG TPA: prolipoprotein diacylglyceryl transferase [Alphaproteobacteria bacterium]|nr:prolipoprotein diacylglyceryl transferase [Alphaproteobacteria bacterium]
MEPLYIDPVALDLGFIQIRWYALSYIVGFILGWRYALHLAKDPLGGVSVKDTDDFFTWAILGVILGGRIGYVVFYNGAHYLQNPLDALKVWQGGMSFHGGLIGVLLAIWLFARSRGLTFFQLGDIVASVVPIGLFFGRLANFVNGELFGRPTDVPWGVVFRDGGPVPRHPSQLYEAVLEGLVLFAILAVLARRPGIRARHGLLGGLFLVGYGVARFFVEFFREPDPQLGFLFAGATMGQLLCLPMIALGGWIIARALRREPAVA